MTGIKNPRVSINLASSLLCSLCNSVLLYRTRGEETHKQHRKHYQNIMRPTGAHLNQQDEDEPEPYILRLLLPPCYLYPPRYGPHTPAWGYGLVIEIYRLHIFLKKQFRTVVVPLKVFFVRSILLDGKRGGCETGYGYIR